MSRGLRLGLAAVAISIALPAGADASKTVGSTLANPVDASATVCDGVEPCTESIAGLGPAAIATGGATVPTDGVIVKWRFKRGIGMAYDASFRLIRGGVGAGQSTAESVPSAGTYEFATRLPAKAGDQIGIDLPSVPLFGVQAAHAGLGGDLLDEWSPPLPEGSTAAPLNDDKPNVELLINAELEPDADGDGFGDETQDACPTNAATQLACAAGAPETTITKAPKKKSKKTKATVEFTGNPVGSVFECSLDFVAYRSCTSPLKLKGLKKGKHTLLVRAVAFGIPDASPASAKFTVKKKKKRK